MTILAFDPSSMVTGWALLEEPQELIEAGLIHPLRRRVAPIERIREIIEDVEKLLDTFCPDDILVEITSGKVGQLRHTGGGAGLGVYGMAVGAVWLACEHWVEQNRHRYGAGCPEVHPIEENLWTRGQPKGNRIAAVASEFPQYRPATDPGGDMGDAIGLALWFIRERSVCQEVTR